MTPYNPKQKYLISPEAVFGLKPLRKYELLFDTLEPCLGGSFTRRTRGRPPASKQALLNALIYKNLKQLPTLFDLASTLIDNSSLATTCGLQPNKTLYSLEERLSSLLKGYPQWPSRNHQNQPRQPTHWAQGNLRQLPLHRLSRCARCCQRK